jgi:excisionase family DNA binding protein
MMNELITKQEVCDWLKVSRATVDRWRAKGMPSVKVGRKVRFESQKVKKWISENFKQYNSPWEDEK